MGLGLDWNWGWDWPGMEVGGTVNGWGWRRWDWGWGWKWVELGAAGNGVDGWGMELMQRVKLMQLVEWMPGGQWTGKEMDGE